jgi:hypothetical protein
MSDQTPSSRQHTRRTLLAGSAAAVAGAIIVPAVHVAGAEPSDRKIRMGVVGGGFGVAFPWHEHPHAVVTGVSDLLPDRRENMAKVFKCEKTYESLEKLILAKDIDAVAVWTPATDHARHVEMVLTRASTPSARCRWASPGKSARRCSKR